MDALYADVERKAIALGNLDEPEDAVRYARGLEVLKSARVVVTERTITPRLADGRWWYEITGEIDAGEVISPICVEQVGFTATSPAYIAVALIPRKYATASEAAALTDTAESGWRNRAAGGHIPGAVKRGKTWLIPWPQAGPKPGGGCRGAKWETRQTDRS